MIYIDKLFCIIYDTENYFLTLQHDKAHFIDIQLIMQYDHMR